MHRMDRARRRATALGRALVASLSLGLLVAPAVPATAAPMPAVMVSPAECVTPVPNGSRCGILTVPLSRAVPDSPEAVLPYVVVPAALDTGRPPLVRLDGGTSLSALDITALTVQGGLAADRDVVFLERRGGPGATPSLDCPSAASAVSAALSATHERVSRIAAVGEAFGSCTEDWRQDGIVPSDFSASAAAADLRDLRQQLGYDRWTVLALGASAGVALAASGVDPAGVAGIVLDGPDLGAPGIVSTSGVAAALAVVRARGAGQDHPADTPTVVQAAAAPGTDTSTTEHARAELPRSTESLSAATEELSARPHRTSGTRPVTVDGDAIVAIASYALSDPTAQAALPALLAAVADGDHRALDALTTRAVAELADGVGIAERVLGCSTAGWPGSIERTDPKVSSTTLLEEVATTACTALAVTPEPAPAPPATSVLILGAPEQAAALADPVAAGAASLLAATFPGSGAAPSVTSACAGIALRTWLSDPADYRAAICDADDAAVTVVDRADVAISPFWVEQASSVTDRVRLLALPALFGLVAVGWSVAWAYRLITRAFGRRSVQDGLLLGVAPVFGAAWAIGGTVVLVRAATSTPAVDLLGVPAALPWLSLVLLVSGLGLVPVWQGAHRGSRPWIVAVSALWAATAAWTASAVLAWW